MQDKNQTIATVDIVGHTMLMGMDLPSLAVMLILRDSYRPRLYPGTSCCLSVVLAPDVRSMSSTVRGCRNDEYTMRTLELLNSKLAPDPTE